MLSGDGAWEVPKEPQPELRGLKSTGVLQGVNGTSSNRDWKDQGASRAGQARLMELPR